MKKQITPIITLAILAGAVVLAGCSSTDTLIRPNDSSVVVYGTPVSGGGSQGTCPGHYVGYVNYTKTVAQGWGWEPSTNATVYTASDGGGRTNTKVEYVGKKGDTGCNQTSVTVPYPAPSAAYRFTIYFTNNVPTTNYPLNLSGFNP